MIRRASFHGGLFVFMYLASASIGAVARAQAPDPLHLYMIVAKHSNKVVDVYDESHEDHAKVQQYHRKGGSNQAWRLIPLEGGYYEIMALHSGKVLDVEGLGLGKNVKVQQYTWNGGDNQRWRLEPSGDDGYYFIVAKHSGKVMDVEGNNPNDHAQIQQYDRNGGDNQKFRFERYIPEGQPPRFQVVMTRLRCDGTTEKGHDEVYYIFGGRNGAGQETKGRGPYIPQGADADGGTAWDMNDNGDNQDRTFNTIMYDEVLSEGQSATLTFAFLESDGSDPGQVISWVGKLTDLIPEDSGDFGQIVKGIGEVFKVLGGLIPKNKDDPLGSFALRIKNVGGKPTLETGPGQFTTVVEPLNNQAGTFEYYFNHDDGKYRAYFLVRLIR
jgi:hypothetical protein